MSYLDGFLSLLGLSKEFYDDYAYNYLKLLKRYDSAKQTGKITINAANKVYVDNTYITKETYLNFLNIFYLASAVQVDFRNPPMVAGIINHFVNLTTQGMISNFLKPSDIKDDTVFALVNAIYFKGDWKTKFERLRTNLVKSLPKMWKHSFNRREIQQINIG